MVVTGIIVKESNREIPGHDMEGSNCKVVLKN